MKLPKLLPIQTYWRLVDELEGRGLDLSYPREVVKSVKRIFMNHGASYFAQNNEYNMLILHPQDGIPYETKLTPNVTKSLKQYFAIRDAVDVYKPGIPRSDEIYDIFLDQDKYFSMCIALKRELPAIVYNIKIGNFKYAALSIASLTNSYNMEVVKLINDYFQTHKFYDKTNKRWYSYLIINNRTYIVSNEVYVAVLIYRYDVNHTYEGDDYAELMYENYDVLTTPDVEHTIKHRVKSKSFLQDCKDVARVKKELTHTTAGIIEFHDLIRYGGYNDSILSIDNINHISEILGHKSWLHQFFVTLALYCDHYLTLDDFKNDIKSESKSLIDPRKIKDLDLFMKAVEYFDSIYDSLKVNPDNE